MTSSTVLAAIAREAELRAEFSDVKAALYWQAAEACRGKLLGPQGLARGMDAMDLWDLNRHTAELYASHELREWWRRHPRLTFPEYERQMMGN